MNKNLTEMIFIMDRSGSMQNLVSDTIGGYNSMNLVGGLTRGDQAFFMATKKAPNVRWNMVTGLLEKLMVDGKEYVLTSQRMQGKEDLEGPEDGHL